MQEELSKAKGELLSLNEIYDSIVPIDETLDKLREAKAINVDFPFFGRTKETFSIVDTSEKTVNDRCLSLLVESIKKGLASDKGVRLRLPRTPPNTNDSWKWAVPSFFCSLMGVAWLIAYFVIKSISNWYSWGGWGFLYWVMILAFIGFGVFFFTKCRKMNDEFRWEHDTYDQRVEAAQKAYAKRFRAAHAYDLADACSATRKKLIEFNEAREKRIPELEGYKNELLDKRDALVKKGPLPSVYANNPNAVVCMLNIIFSRRADTIKELANVYEADKGLHLVISEIRKSNETVITANKRSAKAVSSQLYYLDQCRKELAELKQIVSAPVQISGMVY